MFFSRYIEYIYQLFIMTRRFQFKLINYHPLYRWNRVDADECLYVTCSNFSCMNCTFQKAAERLCYNIPLTDNFTEFHRKLHFITLMLVQIDTRFCFNVVLWKSNNNINKNSNKERTSNVLTSDKRVMGINCCSIRNSDGSSFLILSN